MKTIHKALLALLALLLLAAGGLVIAIRTGPDRALRAAERFVAANADALAPLLDTDAPLPVYPEVVAYNSWDAAHPMDEFILSPHLGVQYSGCYYSPDDVPLGFQNAVSVTSDGESRWSWEGDGDNHGFTVKLRDQWYFFAAWF